MPTGIKLGPGEIDAPSAARLLTITDTRLRQLVKDGWIKSTGKRGVYNTVECVQGYINFLRDEQRRAARSKADSRVRDARAAEIEIRTAERVRNLIPRDEAEGAIDFIFGQFKAELIGLPARVTRDIALRRLIENEIDDALERANKRIDEAGAALQAGHELDATNGEADA